MPTSLLSLTPRFKKAARQILPTVVALGLVFMLGSLVIGILGENPFYVFRLILIAPLASIDDFGYVLFNATPLIFTGLAVAIGFKCGLFNIGCEGQLYVGAFAAAWVGFHFDLPAILLIPLCIGAAMAAGAGWAAIPRHLESQIRRARSHQHHHDELHRHRGDELLGYRGLFGRGRDDSPNAADL